MRDRGVVYLISGNKHAVVLVVSIASLRAFWDGPITVVGTDTAGRELADKLQGDSRLGVESVRMSHGERRRNSGYVNKTRLHQVIDYDKTVFLDADTLVVGEIDEVFPRNDEMVLTTWGGWNTMGKIMSGRVSKWKKAEPELTQRMLGIPWPAINTGVMGWSRETEMVRDWESVTTKNVSFMCDELAAQIMYPDYPVRLLSDRWNCSPLYGLEKSDARVWHFHGKKHLHPKSAGIWYPEYERCVRADYAGISSWTPAGDTRLREWEAKEVE